MNYENYIMRYMQIIELHAMVFRTANTACAIDDCSIYAVFAGPTATAYRPLMYNIYICYMVIYDCVHDVVRNVWKHHEIGGKLTLDLDPSFLSSYLSN